MKPKTVKREGSSNAGAEKYFDTWVAPHPQALLRGICANALVVTMHGMRKVQDLRPGDDLVTRRGGAVPLLSVEETSIATRVIYVVAGSLGHYQLDRDTLLPAEQTVLVRDWRARFIGGSNRMLVTARDLVDGEYVRDIGFMPLTVYRLTCANPAVIYADGMELGTADTEATTKLRSPAV